MECPINVGYNSTVKMAMSYHYHRYGLHSQHTVLQKRHLCNLVQKTNKQDIHKYSLIMHPLPNVRRQQHQKQSDHSKGCA